MSLNDFPKRDDNSELATIAEVAFEQAIAEVGCFLVQQQDRKDYGTDFQIEAMQGGGMTNFRIHVQLKGTDSDANKDGSISISVKRTNLNYMLSHPNSVYICYHATTKQLLVRSADDVFRDLEHQGPGWRIQNSITVRFREPLSGSYQAILHAQAMASSQMRRDDRLEWVTTPPIEFHNKIATQVASIHVPQSPEEAFAALQSLYNNGCDDVISKAFPQFAASIGEDDARMIFAYLSEINLAMRSMEFQSARIRKGIAFIKAVRPVNEPDTLYCRANAHYALGEMGESKRLYVQSITESDGKFPDIEAQCWKNLGSAWEAEGNHAEARRCYEQAISLSPQLLEAHMALAIADREDGKLESALEHFDQVIWSVNDTASTIAARGHRLEVYFRLSLGDKAFDDISVLLPYATRHPWILPWCARLVFNYARTSDAAIGKAIRFWDAYLLLSPNDLAASEERLKCLAQAKMDGQKVTVKFVEFEAQVAAFISDSENADAAHLWDRVGHWAQVDEDWNAAETYFRKAYDIEPDRYGYCLGTALNFLNRSDESLPILLEQATKHQPDAMSWFQVAIAREGTGDIEGCKDAYRHAQELDPEYAAAMFNHGGVLWNSGDRCEAKAVWSDALAKFPDHPLALRLREQFPTLFKAVDDKDRDPG